MCYRQASPQCHYAGWWGPYCRMCCNCEGHKERHAGPRGISSLAKKTIAFETIVLEKALVASISYLKRLRIQLQQPVAISSSILDCFLAIENIDDVEDEHHLSDDGPLNGLPIPLMFRDFARLQWERRRRTLRRMDWDAPSRALWREGRPQEYIVWVKLCGMDNEEAMLARERRWDPKQTGSWKVSIAVEVLPSPDACEYDQPPPTPILDGNGGYTTVRDQPAITAAVLSTARTGELHAWMPTRASPIGSRNLKAWNAKLLGLSAACNKPLTGPFWDRGTTTSLERRLRPLPESSGYFPWDWKGQHAVGHCRHVAGLDPPRIGAGRQVCGMGPLVGSWHGDRRHRRHRGCSPERVLHLASRTTTHAFTHEMVRGGKCASGAAWVANCTHAQGWILDVLSNHRDDGQPAH